MIRVLAIIVRVGTFGYGSVGEKLQMNLLVLSLLQRALCTDTIDCQ